MRVEVLPLHVVFVVFQTGNRANGGVESITQVIERLKRVKPIVVTQLETPVNARWRAVGADVKLWSVPSAAPERFHCGQFVRKITYPVDLVRTNYAMYRLVRSLNPKVVHCNDIRGLWHTGLGAQAAGATVVFNIRDVKQPDEQYDWKWRVAWLSNQLLVLSEEMRESLADRLPIKTRDDKGQSCIDYIYSMVDLAQMRPVSQEERQALRTRLGIDQGKIALGYIAAVNAKKAQLRFIEQAGPLLKKTIPQATLYCIGDFDPKRDAYARSCQRAVQRLRLDEIVSFIGYTTEVADWYKALDIVIIASRREGLARCMIESLACGTPVVSFDVCSAREILERYNCGRVVPQGDYAEFVEQVADLAGSPAVRRVSGTNGSRTAGQLFDPARIVKQYERLYCELAKAPRR